MAEQDVATSTKDTTKDGDELADTNDSQLALQNSVLTGSEASSLCDSEQKAGRRSVSSETSQEETTTIPKSGTITQTSSNRSNSNCSLVKSEHRPIIMGNGRSSHVDFQHSEKEKRTKMEKMRSAFRKSFAKGSKNGSTDKDIKPVIDTSNNNNGMISEQPYYNDGMPRSSTLPAYTNGHLPNTNNRDELDRSATLKPRLLPAYKDQHPFTSNTLQYRERIVSTPSYTSRPRTSSQSSSYSHKYNSRVVSTHIPDHIDKRLVRSRSVGIIPDSEIRMRQTKSASVVKLSEVEDWIV